MSDAPKLLGSAETISGTIWIRLSRAADPTRKRHRVEDLDPDITTEAQARELAHRMSIRAIEVKLARRTPSSTASKSETVPTWADRWHTARTDGEVAGTEVDDRSRLENHVYPILGNRPMRDVTRDDIETIVESLDAKIVAKRKGGKGLSWKTAATIWSLVRTMFRDAVSGDRKLRVRNDDPTLGVRPPKRGEKKTKAFLYPSEYLALVTAPAIWQASGELVNRAKYAPRWTRAITLMIYLQLRPGELRVIRWEDIDLEHRVIHAHKAAVPHTAGKKVKSTKGVLTRHFEIEPALLPLLSAMREEAGGKKATGRIISLPNESDLCSRLREYLRLAGVTREDLFARDNERCPITFHDLRATGITWRTLRDDNPVRVQRAAGHKSFGTTQGYIRTAESLGRAAGEPFPEIPAIVVSGPASGAREPIRSVGRSRHGRARPNVGPKLAQRSANSRKHKENFVTPTGIEPDFMRKTSSNSRHLGPNGPTDDDDRAPSPPVLGPTARALAGALDEAIRAGRGDDAAELAAELAALASVRRRA